MWGLSLPSLRRRLFRCVSIRENTDGTLPSRQCSTYRKKKPSWITGRTLTATRAAPLNSVIPPAVQHLTVEVQLTASIWRRRNGTRRAVECMRFSLRPTSGSGQDSRSVTTAITA
ncbi:hypothetical protein D4M24_19080 [Escherichia coli]|nr:hypothetical protein D4M24_19080 [Escherichia coli]